MRNVSAKISTYRVARAKATLVMQKSSIDHILNNTGPKKDVFSVSKAAGYLAVKNTAAVIPFCHPLPIENVDIDFEVTDTTIDILIEVATIYKTGCEIEAMHGAQIVALTIYDMLKPIDKSVEIRETKLISKSGGKTDFSKQDYSYLSASILVTSDTISAGQKEDKAGKIINDKMQELNINVKDLDIVPDEIETIQSKVESYTKSGSELVLITGGTGLSKRDVTPEAIKPMLDREISGIMESARAYGLQRTPLAMLSRGIAGMIGDSLVVTLPGSSRGARESIDAIFPYVLHIFKVQKKYYQHEDVDNK